MNAAITADEAKLIAGAAESWWESVAHDACQEGVPASCDIADLVISSGALEDERDEQLRFGGAHNIRKAEALEKFLALPPGTRGDFLVRHCEWATP